MNEPTTIKMWRAVRVTPPKCPGTLADCEDGRIAVVRFVSHGDMLVRRLHKGTVVGSEFGSINSTPSEYTFICYLDDPQQTAPKVPTTFGELRDGQCFMKNGETAWRVRAGLMARLTVDSEIEARYIDPITPITFLPDIEMVLEEQP